jgi:hypothetical protein
MAQQVYCPLAEMIVTRLSYMNKEILGLDVLREYPPTFLVEKRWTACDFSICQRVIS